MIKPVSIRLQALALAACLVLAGALWFGQEQLSGALAGLTGAQDGKGRKAGRRRRGGRTIPVIVAEVALNRSDGSISAVGTARARRSIMLHAKSDGVIMTFGPKPGDRVEAGQEIFRLDTTQAELAVKLAEKRLEDARRLLNRQKQLKRRRVASSAKVDDNRVAAERAELELQQAQKTLRDLSIVAPFAGVLGLATVEVGDRVATSTPVVSLDMRADLLIEFPIPERYATRIAKGNELAAVTPGFPDKRFVGRIEYIDSRVDPASRTVKVRAVFPNKDDLLRPGMSFAVELVLKGKEFPTVPELSLQWRKGESFVWMVRDGKASKVLVRTVQRQNSRVLIEGQIEAGELVVVEGVQRLRDGRGVQFDPVGKPNDNSKDRRQSARRSPGASPVKAKVRRQ